MRKAEEWILTSENGEPQMVTLVSSTDVPQLIPQFQQWVEDQWGSVQAPAVFPGESDFPTPIFALENDKLLGGLAFTRHIKPDDDSMGVWINALYVSPDHRKRGIAASLIQIAEVEAVKFGIDELYVYTDVPIIYQKHRWEICKTVDDHTVLRRALAG